jgi:hypothetical protein
MEITLQHTDILDTVLDFADTDLLKHLFFLSRTFNGRILKMLWTSARCTVTTASRTFQIKSMKREDITLHSNSHQFHPPPPGYKLIRYLECRQSCMIQSLLISLNHCIPSLKKLSMFIGTFASDMFVFRHFAEKHCLLNEIELVFTGEQEKSGEQALIGYAIACQLSLKTIQLKLKRRNLDHFVERVVTQLEPFGKSLFALTIDFEEPQVMDWAKVVPNLRLIHVEELSLSNVLVQDEGAGGLIAIIQMLQVKKVKLQGVQFIIGNLQVMDVPTSFVSNLRHHCPRLIKLDVMPI